MLKDNQVEVIIEAKKPENFKEFFSEKNPNCKALHECVLYYLREREKGNINLNFIIITNFYEFYVFRVAEFKRYFYKNKDIDNLYKILNKKGSEIENQTEFYEELSKILNKEFKGDREGNLFNTTLKGTYFNLNEPKELNYVHQILSREFLHNEFKKDTNALNKGFYNELLYILGLKEFNQNGKILIDFDESQETSFAKAIYKELQESHHQTNYEAKEFTMNHIIIWLNRILFLKLLEASLLKFNDFDEKLKFLTSEKIKSFNDLHHLFFEVLAKDYKQRDKDEGFNFLPYLNSSLFYYNEVKEPLRINELKNNKLKIKIFAMSILETKESSINFLNYLFDFLASYDFGKSSLNKEGEEYKAKELINSSVLGSVFEKLNGYKEGSFYTPSFITSYMCKESLSKIVCEKFNAKFGYKIQNLKELRTQIDRNFAQHENDFKALLKSIKICDPAVGSGHFLVSALNEMIYIYHALGLLGFAYKDFSLKSDEIHIITKDSKPFIYKRSDDENHQIEQKLFALKKDIIENNLFGVDINPNSCEIARLRLWIELLKHSYYVDFTDKHTHKLETLPNIDINIKCGNSLVSNIPLELSLENFTRNLKRRQSKADDLFSSQYFESKIQDLEKKAKTHFQSLNENVKSYKNESDKQFAQNYKQKYEKSYTYLCELFKKNCDEFIDFHRKLETFFENYGYINLRNLDDEDIKFKIESYVVDFEFHKDVDYERKAQREISQKDLKELLTLMQIYEEFKEQRTFEWRFAFPEVLDDEGDFVGFDLIIGNPPYIKEPDNKALFENTKNLRTYQGKMDIWYHFVGRGFDILKNNGILTFIATNNWTTNAGAKRLRNVVLSESQILNLVDFGSYMVFDSASIQTMIMEFKKKKPTQNYDFLFSKISNLKPTYKHALMLLEKIEFEDNITLYNIDFTPEKFIDKTLNFNKNSYDDILNKIESIKNFNLNEKEIAQGIVYPQENVNKKSLEILGKNFYIGQGIQKLTNEEIKKLKLLEREKNLLKPIFESNNIEKYFVEKDNNFWVIYTNSSFKNPNSMDKYPNLKKHLDRFKDVITSDNKPYGLHRARDESFFTGSPRIIALRKCVGEPKFSYVDFDCYVSATFYVIKTQRINLKYLVGLLNSKLVAFWLKHKGKMQGNNYQIDKEPLLNIPLVKINSKNKKLANEIIALVDEILKTKAKDSTTNTSTLENQIDNLVYKLYNLNEEEIKIIEE